MRIFTNLMLPLGMIALGTLTASTASAALITYTTSGVFACNGIAGCTTSGNQAFLGGLTLTYTGQASTSVTPTPVSAANYGRISVNGPIPTNNVTLSGITLAISVLQTSPFSQSNGGWNGIITGNLGIAANGSSTGFASICFISTACGNQIESFTYTSGASSVSYRIQTPQNSAPPPTNGYALRAFVTGGTPEATTFQGSVVDNTVPEPASYLMMMSGLFAVGLMGRRKS
jgi:hypothetical protein